ncbi:hypothetical protein ACH5RR_007174 [Cinchona calisaya]|uniref:Calmodulin-binding domain-containing protein n=1 Tax=Cinchona calisaya TaxID=153742 RepID=A0ABD3AR50_9GENT
MREGLISVESTFSQNLYSRNRGTEPRMKLRKRWSIKVSKGSYLRQSSKSQKSHIEWPPVDESSEIVTLSDSSQNYMKSTNCSSAKKDGSQAKSECDDVNSVLSSSCGSSDRVVLPSIVMSDDPEMHHQPSSVEVSDTSPNSLKGTKFSDGRKLQFRASSRDSESSYDSSDHSRNSRYEPMKSVYCGQKSLQTLTRSCSTRAVRILFKKSSFKLKRTSLKISQVSEDLNVERATCSSTIKDSRFPERVELEPGQTESERISFVKVCRYHHCSLNGHCHDPPPPKKPFLRRKRQSSMPQISLKPSSTVSGPGTNGKRKGAKKHPIMTSNAETSVHEACLLEKDKIRNSFTQEEDIPEATFELKERSLGCYSRRKEEISNSTALGVVSEGHETATSRIIYRENNDNFSHTDSLKYSTKPDVKISIIGDNNTDSKSIENNSSHITRNLMSCDIDEAENSYNVVSPDSHNLQDPSLRREETNSNQKPKGVLGDSEHKEQDPTRDSEPALYLGVQKPQFGKRRNISMWHLIHKHMVSGLAAEDGTKKLQRAHEGSRVEEAGMDTTRKGSDISLDFSDSDMGTYSQDEENQDVEIRKLYAIKLVREAIEKILLPEVQDQLSENQSVTSDIVEDQELSEKNHQEADPRMQVQADDNISGQERKKSEAKLENKSDKKSLSNWSNLKKWILLQRFTKELEKVRKLNLKKPRQLQLETEPGAEKISLRRQTVDEKKKAEEWMLDYALQQVVSQLAPTQKRKVSLLVKAFETVVPPQQDSNIQVQYNVTSTADAWRRSSVHVEHYETNNHHMPVVDEVQLSTGTSLKLDCLENSSCNDVPLDESEREINVEELSSLKTEVFNCGPQSESKLEKINDSNTVAGEQSYSMQRETVEVEMKSIASEETLQVSYENSADNLRVYGVDNRKPERENVDLSGIHDDANLRPNSELSSDDSVLSTKRIELGDVDDKAEKLLNTSQSFIINRVEETPTTENLDGSSLEQQTPASKDTKRESRPETIVGQMFPPLDFKLNYKENEAGQSLLDKQNYLRMWHSVCQHVVSSVATKVGIEMLGEEFEEVEAAKLPSVRTPGSRKDTPIGSHDMAEEIHVASYHQAEFSRNQVLKLVKEAVQEILSPEIQDDSSDTLSVSSDQIPPVKELSEKVYSDGAKQNLLNSTGLTEQNTGEFHRSEEGDSLVEEKESKGNAIAVENCKKVELLNKGNSDPPKPKNWSKLKKLILLKRSIKAMETARKLKPQPQEQLPMSSDAEPEKVDLRHQMMDERRKAEQWMLDYAVQHIVTKLTPARKTRVAMLVEAFETVVPLPEI